MNAFASFLNGMIDGVEANARRNEGDKAPAGRGARRPAPFEPRPVQRPADLGELKTLIDQREGAGDYSTLFGFAQRDGGKFSGVNVTDMTLGQLYGFTDPSGDYGQWVKSRNGQVATPLGRYQIVGATLRQTAKAMGLPENTKFTPEVQDRMFSYLAQQRLARSNGGLPAKLAGLRNEWAGLRSVPDDVLASAISTFETQQGRGVRPPAGVQSWR